MPPDAPAARPLSRKRRLHPIAIVTPGGTHAGPHRAGGFGSRAWAALAILVIVLLAIDINLGDVRSQPDYLDVPIIITTSSETPEPTADEIESKLVLGPIVFHHLSEEVAVTIVVGLFAGIVGVAISSIIRWWRFRWWVEDDAIWTSGGMVTRWTRKVALERIVVFARSSTPVQRALGVAGIAIDTAAAGGNHADVSLRWLSRTDAKRLEDHLRANLLCGGDAGRASRLAPTLLVRMRWRDVIVAGTTNVQATTAALVLYALIRTTQAWTGVSLSSEYGHLAQRVAGRYVGVAEVVGLIVILWLASTCTFVASFFRFTLGKHEGWLIIETGLYRQVRRVVRTDAIQGLEISRSPLQRHPGNTRAMLRMCLPGATWGAHDGAVLHPAVPMETVPALALEVAGMDRAASEAMCGVGIHRVGIEARRSCVTFWPSGLVALGAILLVATLALAPHLWWWAFAPLTLAMPIEALGRLSWRSSGWQVIDGDWLVLQRGALTVTATAARVEHIRFLAWSQGSRFTASSQMSLVVSLATSTGTNPVSRLLGYLHLKFLRWPGNPALIRIRAMTATDAGRLARAIHLPSSLPPAGKTE